MDDPEQDVATAQWTYQYLRFSVLAVVLGLFIAIAIEWAQSSGCLQRSISAYYYTPVGAVFVGAVVAMGVCIPTDQQTGANRLGLARTASAAE